VESAVAAQHLRELPHNIFVEAGAELGYTGLLAFISLIGVTFLMNYRTRKAARRMRAGTGACQRG
jgi:O-antigen ligase